MRVLLIAAIVSLLSGSALAQSHQMTAQDLAAMKNFGNVICNAHLLCPSDLANTSLLINDANACLSQYLGMHNPAGYFEDEAPDSDGCLTTKTSSLETISGVTMSPQCCAVQSGNDCTMHCSLQKL